MRNPEKDERMMAERRERMLSEGFRIFAEKGIEPVSMQEVAAACGLGIATLYRYYSDYYGIEYYGFLEAVADALDIDFTNPNATLSRGKGGRGRK